MIGKRDAMPGLSAGIQTGAYESEYAPPGTYSESIRLVKIYHRVVIDRHL